MLRIALAIGWLLGSSGVAQQPAAPQGRPVVYVEVQVSVSDGAALPDLAARQFDVALDGRPLPVVSAQRFRNAAGPQSGNASRKGIETSASYRLAIQPASSDHDGNVHDLTVRVDAGGREVRVQAPAQVRLRIPNPPPSSSARSAETAAAPTEADVAAWDRLWGGAVPPPAAPAGASVSAATTAAAGAPADRPTADAPPPSSAPSAVVEELLQKYSSGDRGVLLRELRSPADFERVRPDLVSTLARWRTDWSPAHAAFALEVAVTAYARRWPSPPMFLTAARDIVTARPDAPGVRPDDDELELRFHRAAVAMLAVLDGQDAVETYLSSIQNRVLLSATPPRGVLLKDAQLVLARAAARETRTLSRSSTPRDDPRTWVVAANDAATRRELGDIDALLRMAADDEDARAEALVRRAFIQYRLGANEEALTLLEESAPTDDVVDYWRSLVEGRVLLALDRRDEARAELERAAMLAPDAQTPAVALTALFLKIGDRDGALGWAERARTTTENGGAPWPLYWAGSGRFLTRWLTDLRETRP